MTKKTSKQEFKQAVESLSIVSVVPRNIKAEMADNMPWDWQDIRAKGAELQFLNSPVSCEKGVTHKSNSKESVNAYVYKHSFGVRLVEKIEKKSKEPQVLLTIEAEYNAVYELLPDKKELSQEAVKSFGAHNVPFNLWPFWRELVHSTTQKMGVSEIMLPLNVPKKK